MGGCLRLRLAVCSEECHRLDPDSAGKALQASERQIVLSSFEAPKVRRMNAERLGEGLSTEASSLTVRREIASQHRLQLTFHGGEQSWPDTYRSTEL